MAFLRQKIRWMNVEISLKDAGDVSHYKDDITLVVPFSSLLSLSLPACFYTDIETCGKATRQKCSTMEKSGNICQSGQKTDSRGPNMMSGSEAATADTVSLRSSSLFIISSNHQTHHALAVISRFYARINTGRPQNSWDPHFPEVVLGNFPTKEPSIFVHE